MIENSEKIQSMLSNILEQVRIIKNDFNENGKTHCVYIEEKLEKAKWDLDALYSKALEEKKRLEKEIK